MHTWRLLSVSRDCLHQNIDIVCLATMCPCGHSIRSKYCLFMEKQNEHQLLACWIIIPQQSLSDIVLVLFVCPSIRTSKYVFCGRCNFKYISLWRKKETSSRFFYDVGQYLLTLACTCRLLKTFTNSLDPDLARENAGPDLDPNCVTL